MKSLKAKLILWGVVVSILGVGLTAYLLSETSLSNLEMAYHSEARARAHDLLEVFNAIGTTNLGIAKSFASSDIVNEGLKLGVEAGKGIAGFKIERLINPIFEKMKNEGIDFVIVFNDKGEWVYEAGLGLKEDAVVPEAQMALSVLNSKTDQKTVFKGSKGMEKKRDTPFLQNSWRKKVEEVEEAIPPQGGEGLKRVPLFQGLKTLLEEGL